MTRKARIATKIEGAPSSQTITKNIKALEKFASRRDGRMRDRDWNSVGDEYFNVTVYDEGFNQVHLTMFGGELGDSITLDNRQALKLCDAIHRTIRNQRKPWTDAKPGEIWVLTLVGRDAPQPATTDEGSFILGDTTILRNDQNILSAYRIWPEEGDEQ